MKIESLFIECKTAGKLARTNIYTRVEAMWCAELHLLVVNMEWNYGGDDPDSEEMVALGDHERRSCVTTHDPYPDVLRAALSMAHDFYDEIASKVDKCAK